MPEPTQPTKPPIDYAAELRHQNIMTAFNMIRNLTIHCVMYLPGPELDDPTKALLHSHLMKAANLYDPGKATV